MTDHATTTPDDTAAAEAAEAPAGVSRRGMLGLLGAGVSSGVVVA